MKERQKIVQHQVLVHNHCCEVGLESSLQGSDFHFLRLGCQHEAEQEEVVQGCVPHLQVSVKDSCSTISLKEGHSRQALIPDYFYAVEFPQEVQA